MEDDIRLYPSSIMVIDGKERRVYEYDGYKCYLSETKNSYPHATVYLYTVITPDGVRHENIDLAEANDIIFYSGTMLKPSPSDIYEREIYDIF